MCLHLGHCKTVSHCIIFIFPGFISIIAPVVKSTVTLAVIMGCCMCHCCLSEDDQIKRILRKLSVCRVKDLQYEQLNIHVGRVVMTQTPLIAPISNLQCCYYEVVVEETAGKGYAMSSVVQILYFRTRKVPLHISKVQLTRLRFMPNLMPVAVVVVCFIRPYQLNPTRT